jgi:hypothetical protein
MRYRYRRSEAQVRAWNPLFMSRTPATQQSSGSRAFMARRNASGAHRSGTIALAAMPIACTPASVRPAAWTRMAALHSRASTRSISAWTVRPAACRCQPANRPPS